MRRSTPASTFAKSVAAMAQQEQSPSHVGACGARVFELFGPAGVGKTHVLRALVKRRSMHAATWKTVPEALMYRQDLGATLRAVVSRVEDRSPLLRRMLYRTLPDADKRRALLSMSADWRPFIECCLMSGSNDQRNPEGRLLAMQSLANALELRALLASSCAYGTVVVSDEPLSHKCFKVLSEGARDETRERGYFQTMPLPAGLVLFCAPVDEIVERLQRRELKKGYTLLRHRDLTEQQIRTNTQWAIEIAELGAAILRTRGVPVLYVDATRPLEAILPQIERFIEGGEFRPASVHRGASAA